MTPITPATSPPQSTRTLLLGIWSHLSRRRRIQLGHLLLVMLASGGSELVSLGAVLPFLAVLTDPVSHRIITQTKPLSRAISIF